MMSIEKKIIDIIGTKNSTLNTRKVLNWCPHE